MPAAAMPHTPSLAPPASGDGAAERPLDDEAPLLSPQVMARLSRLSVVARRMSAARRRGLRRNRRVGHGVERIDTRTYCQGDDLRRIHWPAYARFERLLVWLVADEVPLRLGLLVDASGSMNAGQPTKLTQAKRIAAGLAAIALGSEDRVAAVAASAGPDRVLGAQRGRHRLVQLLVMLDSLAAVGATNLAAAAEAMTGAMGGRGLCVILSDLLDPAGALAGARALKLRGHEVALVEVLAPFELDPPDWSGEALEDEETGEVVELPVTGAREAYRQALRAYHAELETRAAQLAMPLLRVTTAEPFDAIVRRALEAGLLRGGSPP